MQQGRLNSEIVNTLNILEKYSTQEAKGKDAQGREYLTLCEGAIALTADKAKEASGPQLSQYLSNLINKLKKGSVTHGTPQQRANAQKTILHALEVIAPPLADMEDELNTHLASNTIDIPSDNPFYETDLIVFKDDYQGALPLNGILEKDFALISTKINQLKVDGRTDGIEINKEEGPSEKNLARRSQSMINAFVQLCTRQVGRELIGGFSDQGKKIYINFSTSPAGGEMSPGFASSESPGDELFERVVSDVSYKFKSSGQAAITFNPELTVDLQVKKNNVEWNDPTPPFLVLGHEMVHALHYFTDPKNFFARLGALHEKSDNMEEFVTILGREEEVAVLGPEGEEKVLLQESGDWELALAESSLPLSLWDPKSENGLRSVYSMPPRTESHHTGTIHANAETFLADFLNEIKSGQTVNLEEAFSPRFKEMVLQYYEWDDVLSQSLEKACKSKQWEIAEQLVKMEAKFKPGDSYEKSVMDSVLSSELIFAMCEKNENLINLLTTLGAKPVDPQALQNAGYELMVARTQELRSIDFNRLTPAFREVMGAKWTELLKKISGRVASSTELDQLIALGLDETSFQANSALGNLINKCIVASRWDLAYPLIKREIKPDSSKYFVAAMKTFKNIDEAVARLTALVKECKLDLNWHNSALLTAVAYSKYNLIVPILNLGANPQHKNNQEAFKEICKQTRDMELIELLVKEYKFNPNEAISTANTKAKEKLEELAKTYEAPPVDSDSDSDV